MTGRQFWQDKRVFITGHTGFKGSWLSLWLQGLGAQVTGFALNPPTTPSMFEVAGVARGMTSIIGDIRDSQALSDALCSANPQVVIHMAAQPLVRYSYGNPVDTYATNVMGTVHLLEAVRRARSVKAVVTVTSDKCYENREWPWGYRENEAMGGHDPYSSSKGCAELVTAAYRNSYFSTDKAQGPDVSLASVRAGNVIGGGDWAEDRLIPDFLRAIVSGAEVVIRSPHAIRPWQHVMEPLSGYLSLAQALFEKGASYAEGWNFGPYDHDAKPVGWIVAEFSRLWGEGACYRVDQSAADLHEAHYLKLDCSKAQMYLRWQPCWSLGQTLEKIVTWHKAHLSNRTDMRAFTLEQISSYKLPNQSPSSH